MSYSKRQNLSAYQAYSSASHYPKSGRHNNRAYGSEVARHSVSSRRLLDGKKGKTIFKDGRDHRQPNYNSDEEMNKDYSHTPKSLMASLPTNTSKEHSSKKFRSTESLLHRDNSVRSRHPENDRKPMAQSLMDIDFSSSHSNAAPSRGNLSEWKNMPSHEGVSSDDDSHDHLDRRSDWKRGRRFSKYSDSEEEDKGEFWHSSINRSRRTWKDSAPTSNSSTRHTPVIIDLPGRLSNNDRRKVQGDSAQRPKPLLETYVAPPVKKPVSLLDLPSATGNNNESRLRRKKGARSGLSFSSGERKYSQESKSSSSSRKRPASEEESDSPAMKMRVVKVKSEMKERQVVQESCRISVCKSSGHTFLIIPSHCSSLYLHGRAKITVLIGNVNILGWKLRIGTAYDVYSPASGCLLALNVGDGGKTKAAEVREELSKYNIPESDKDLEHIGNNTIAVLLLDKLESTVCEYVTSFIPYTQLFTAVPSRDIEVTDLRGITLPKLGLKVAPLKEMVPACLNMSQDYEDVLNKWTAKLIAGVEAKTSPILLCCGAKNCGKSTFNRVLINTSLKSVNAIGYLECDVGQTEFSPPATLSLHVIKYPVLGPPFCNQRHAEKMVFYGDTSPSHDPSLYIKCLKFIVEAYKELSPSVPLVVNTMGFPEGIGLMLLIDTVLLVEPDLVVQIESFNQAANFPAMTHERVALEEGWTFNKTPAKDPGKKVAETRVHELSLLSTLVSQRRDFSFKLKPVDLRNLTLLSALSLGLERGMTLTSLPPYTVSYRHVGVHVCHHSMVGEDLLNAIDASVVALCVTNLSQAHRENDELPYMFDSMPVCTCLGLGIIRGVDVRRGLLFLVTTIPRVSLRHVNTILKSSLALPDQIILKQKSSTPVPYVDALAPSTAVGSVRPRSRMPRVTLGPNK